ncbi:hypothetical protein U5N28_14775 [Lysinibacillus telephonicus]|uniref:hypothetical protein n=1 Tax=Lysinibacillus telephonicus TaxID=1714840 RepID=UPI0039786836
MKKSVSLILLLLIFSSYFILRLDTKGDNSFASEIETSEPYEKIYSDIGYKTVEEAAREFEQHFNQELKLPLRVPPISFTHHFGRFSNLEGDMNDTFEITLISEQEPQSHFKIDVRPIKHKIQFSDKNVSEVFKLNNGSNAKYMEKLSQGFNHLLFENDNWQYMLSIDKDVSNIVTPEILVQIANSIDY